PAVARNHEDPAGRRCHSDIYGCYGHGLTRVESDGRGLRPRYVLTSRSRRPSWSLQTGRSWRSLRAGLSALVFFASVFVFFTIVSVLFVTVIVARIRRYHREQHAKRKDDRERDQEIPLHLCLPRLSVVDRSHNLENEKRVLSESLPFRGQFGTVRTIGKLDPSLITISAPQRTVRYTPNSLLISSLIGMRLPPDSPHQNPYICFRVESSGVKSCNRPASSVRPEYHHRIALTQVGLEMKACAMLSGWRSGWLEKGKYFHGGTSAPSTSSRPAPSQLSHRPKGYIAHRGLSALRGDGTTRRLYRQGLRSIIRANVDADGRIFSPPVLSRERVSLAFAVAVATDVLQLALGPFG